MGSKDRSIFRRGADGLRGLRQGWRREQSLRTQVALSITAFGLVLILQPPIVWQLALAVSLTVGFAAELLNASIEALLDRLHPDHDAEIGVAKDLGSASVLVVNCTSTAIFAGALLASLGRL